MIPSVIGLRSIWTCARCGLTAEHHQFLFIGSGMIDAPPGWFIDDAHHSICPSSHRNDRDPSPEGAD